MKENMIQLFASIFFIASILLFSSVQLSAYQQSGSCHEGDPSPCNDIGCPDTGNEVCSAMLCDDAYGTEYCMDRGLEGGT